MRTFSVKVSDQHKVLKQARSESVIDTDKYEGHTPAPWWCNEDDWRCIDTMIKHEKGEDLQEICRVFYREVGYDGKPLPNGPVGFNRATAQLIADAPLLLAEVERLRKRQETMMHWLLKTKDSEWEDKEYVLTRIDEGYDLDTMIEIYEARVDMFGCSIEDDILDTLKGLIE